MFREEKKGGGERMDGSKEAGWGMGELELDEAKGGRGTDILCKHLHNIEPRIRKNPPNSKALAFNVPSVLHSSAREPKKFPTSPPHHPDFSRKA